MQQSPNKEKRYKGQGHQGSKGKPKFQNDRIEKAKAQTIVPMNEKQKIYLKALQEGVPIIVVTGFAGSSKSFIPTKYSCLQLLQDRLYKFVLTRPAISSSKSLGYFTGDAVQKSLVWLAPVLSTVKEVLGQERTELAIKREDITFIPLEVIKGASLSSNDPNRPIIFLVEEASDLTKDEIIKLVTRIGKNCTLVLAGDILQSELKEKSGLAWLLQFMKNNNLSDNFVHIDFNHVNDIVRSDVVKEFITHLHRTGEMKLQDGK